MKKILIFSIAYISFLCASFQSESSALKAQENPVNLFASLSHATDRTAKIESPILKKIKLDRLSTKGNTVSYLYTYDSINRCDSIFKRINSTTEITEYELTVIKYNTQGMDSEYVLYKQNSGTWQAATRIELNYNARGLLSTKTLSMWENAQWKTSEIEIYTYNTEGLLERMIRQIDAEANGQLQNTFKAEYTYGNTNNWTTYIQFQFIEERWDTLSTKFRNYDGQNLVQEREVDTDGNGYRDDYAYDFDNGLLFLKTCYSLQGNANALKARYEYNYDSKFVLTEVVEYIRSVYNTWRIYSITAYEVDEQGLSNSKIYSRSDSTTGMILPCTKEEYAYYRPMTAVEQLIYIQGYPYVSCENIQALVDNNIIRFAITERKKFTYIDNQWISDSLHFEHAYYSELNPNLAKDTIYLSGCDSVVYKGNTYKQKNSFEEMIKDIEQRDSLLLTVHITINHPSENTLNLRGCKMVSYNNKVYEKDTVLTEFFVNSQDCDSIVTAYIRVYPEYTADIHDSIYRNLLPYTKHGFILSPIGTDTTATIVLESWHGCDSIINLTLKILDTVVSNAFDKTAQSIKMYPNPVQSYLHIEFGEADCHQLILYDIKGQKLMDLVNPRGSISMNEYKEGVYIIAIKNKQGRHIHSQTIIKK